MSIVSMRTGSGGWIEAIDDDMPDGTIYARFTPSSSGRLHCAELFLSFPGERINATVLRGVTLGQIEGMANGPAMRDAIVESTNAGPDVRAALVGLVFPERRDVYAADTLTVALTDSAKARRADARVQLRAALKLATGNKYPDDFYRHVARAYGEYASITGKPAVELADAAKVPTTTVHRWLKEARRRGFLGPGRERNVGDE